MKLDTSIEVKQIKHTFPLSDFFLEKLTKRFVLLCTKEINYSSRVVHALLAHCQTEVHRQKPVSDLLISVTL